MPFPLREQESGGDTGAERIRSFPEISARRAGKAGQ